MDKELEHFEAWCEGASKYYLTKFEYIHRCCTVVRSKETHELTKKKTYDTHANGCSIRIYIWSPTIFHEVILNNLKLKNPNQSNCTVSTLPNDNLTLINGSFLAPINFGPRASSHSLTHSRNQSINQSFNQSINYPPNQPINQSVCAFKVMFSLVSFVDKELYLLWCVYLNHDNLNLVCEFSLRGWESIWDIWVSVLVYWNFSCILLHWTHEFCDWWYRRLPDDLQHRAVTPVTTSIILHRKCIGLI